MALKLLTGADFNAQRAQNAADPSVATDLATKQYVDNFIAGLAWKDEVRVATTANGALATAFANGQTIDGIVLVTNDRILVKDQTTQTENGLYKVNVSGAPTRTTDADSTAELNNATVLITDGTVNSGRAYTQVTKNPVVGTNIIVFNQFATGIAYTADGSGIELSGTVFSIELDGSSLSKSAAGFRIASAAAGLGLVEAAGILAVGPGVGILANANDVAIDTTVVVRKYAVDIGNGALTSIPVTHNLGTKDVEVQIRETAGDAMVMTEWVATSTTVVTLSFPTAPTSNQYRVVVQA